MFLPLEGSFTEKFENFFTWVASLLCSSSEKMTKTQSYKYENVVFSIKKKNLLNSQAHSQVARTTIGRTEGAGSILARSDFFLHDSKLMIIFA
jgi:hypothetical protein